MDKIGRTRGLVAYETWTNIERGRRGEPPRRRLLRPKTLGLAAAVLVLLGGMAVAFGRRDDGRISVAHDRNPVAVRLVDGSSRNGFAVRLSNMAGAERSFVLSVTGLADGRVALAGGGDAVPVPADATREVRLLVSSAARTRQPITVIATDPATGAAFAADDFFIPVEGGS